MVMRVVGTGIVAVVHATCLDVIVITDVNQAILMNNSNVDIIAQPSVPTMPSLCSKCTFIM